MFIKSFSIRTLNNRMIKVSVITTIIKISFWIRATVKSYQGMNILKTKTIIKSWAAAPKTKLKIFMIKSSDRMIILKTILLL